MQLNPLHDRVVVKVLDAESKSAGGIFIPDNAQEKPNTGKVLAIGAGRKTTEGIVVSMTVKPGDTVMFGKNAGQTVKANGEEVVVLKEEDIFAIVE